VVVVLKSVVIVVKNVLTSGIEGCNMNEQIKVLMEQAGILEWPEYKPDIVKVLSKKQVYEFAELIVRECITVLDENDGAMHHTELLKKHFGVEE
jgi:hypothetical protein